MNLLVCVKQVPDAQEVPMGADNTLRREAVPQVINPADESALGHALALKGKHGATVTVLTMGPPGAEGMLREALARGADRAILLTDPAFAGADTLATARTLRAAAGKSGPYDLILCGLRAVDGETGQVGPALAALLDAPVVTSVTALALQADGALQATQLGDRDERVWRIERRPAVLTVCVGSCVPPLPTLLGLRRARSVEVLRWDRVALGLAAGDCGLKGSPTRVIRVRTQEQGARACQWTTARELLDKGVLG